MRVKNSTDVVNNKLCKIKIDQVVTCETLTYSKFLLLGGGGRLKPKNQRFATDFHSKKQKQKVGGRKRIHFLKALFKTYSKINVW